MVQLAKTVDQKRFWHSLRPINRVLTTDTYKRTMSGSSHLFADNFSCYNLAARRSINEDGVNGRLVMAGLEKMLYPWFMNPVPRDELNAALDFVAQHATVDKFPLAQWEKVMDNDGRFPLDVYALPGGQTFLIKDGKHVPIASVEGPGALVSHLEPHLETLYAPIIQATKARLFYEAAGSQFAEFGLRSDHTMNNHVTLLMALTVGGGFSLTSDDQAAFLFPEYFKDIGTVGHEFLMAYQRDGISLEHAQEEAYRVFVESNTRSALLPDTIDTLHSGLPAILKLVKEYESTDKVIMPRFDSGDVTVQCIAWKKMTLEAGIMHTQMVVEDGYTPTKARATKEAYAHAGFNPDDIIVGAGGYFQKGCSRDAISLAYKRSATRHDDVLEPSMKFSDSPGKQSIPGHVRVYGKDSTLIVAQVDESIDATPLMVKVLDQGRIVYNESLHEQHERAKKTWDAYDTIAYSEKTQKIINARTQEKGSVLARIKGD